MLSVPYNSTAPRYGANRVSFPEIRKAGGKGGAASRNQ